MPKLFESTMPPDYGEVPLPPAPEEASEHQRADRAREREAAEQAFLETLTANQASGATMPAEFRERYERKLGKVRVAELIREFEELELFGAKE
ncbi:MAG: hypothetical protein Q7S84_01555 [bacterium]|nr:hypothetical protein [bacterium]